MVKSQELEKPKQQTSGEWQKTATPRLGYSFFEAKLFVDNIRIRELKML